MAYKIMIDAGHGGRDPGAVYEERQEKDDTLELALTVGELLKQEGIEVEYTRTVDIYDTPAQKAQKANSSGADLFISIHRNSFPMENAAFGVETLIYDKSGLKYELAERICEALEEVGFRNLGVKERPNLVVLRRTEMPAVLIEVGFVNSDVDNRIFDEKFDAIAEAIAESILNVLRENGLIGEQKGCSERTEIECKGKYRVQVGAFRNSAYAERLCNELLEQEFPAYIDDSGEYNRVMVGSYPTLEEAAVMERRLRRDGYQTVLRRS